MMDVSIGKFEPMCRSYLRGESEIILMKVAWDI